MNQGHVERRVWSNSASGYLRSAIRLILGVISFRQLCAELSSEELGFYGLVWSFLGYGVLFDFGVGVAVQKRTAELLQCKDWHSLGRVISSVMVFNVICALLIIFFGLIATESILRAIAVSPENLDTFRTGWRVFIVGLGVMYPFQMFGEVHYGQQRIAAGDGIGTIGGLFSFAWLVLALRMHWGIALIFTGQTVCLLMTGIALAISGFRGMPEVRLEIRLVSWDVLRSLARFSAHAYLVVFAGIAVLQTDRFLVGAVLSVAAVATYHIGAKIPELFSAFTWQLPHALAPAAATLHARGQHLHWQRFFLRSIRVNALITTPLFVLCFVFLENLLSLLTRGRASGPDVLVLGRILLFWSYSTILTHGVTKAVFLMSGRESRLMRLLVIEALCNLVISFVLLHSLASPIGAALGSLVPAIVMGWFFLWPWAAREMGMNSARLARDTLGPAWRAVMPLLVFGVSCQFVPNLDSRMNIWVFVLEGSLGAIIALVGTWHLGLTSDERSSISTKMAARLTQIRIMRPWFS